ncbi:MAG: hypothetical protein QOF04_222 [Solirubrobacteraceae bacterium]|nr:hypothetical protein [Solirubrobacteraceae bacterium]
MPPHRHTHPGVTPSLSRRRGGREGPRELTKAFRRYVERVQALDDASAARDLAAALDLAADVMGHERDAEVDASLAAGHGAPMLRLATAVRRAGRGAVAQPALLARAIVVARTLERTGAGRFAGARTERELVGAGR